MIDLESAVESDKGIGSIFIVHSKITEQVEKRVRAIPQIIKILLRAYPNCEDTHATVLATKYVT